MIDFKEKVRKEANEILGESIELDEGLRSGLVSLKNGVFKAKGKYDVYKNNREKKAQEKLAVNALKQFSNMMYRENQKIDIGLKNLVKVNSIDDAVKVLSELKSVVMEMERKANGEINFLKSQAKHIAELD